MYQSQNAILHLRTGLKKSDILKVSYNHKPGNEEEEMVIL